MRHAKLTQALSLRCTQVSDDVTYLETNVTTPVSGTIVGGYVQTLGEGRVRLSDNGQTLFEALSRGGIPNKINVHAVEKLAKQFGVGISDEGEVFAECDEGELVGLFPRYAEAIYAIDAAALEWPPESAMQP